MQDPQLDQQAAHFAAIESHTVQLGAHQCHYLACGPETGPLIFFVHGWPELSRLWRSRI